METYNIQLIFLIIHLIGTALGAGGAFTVAGTFPGIIRDQKISKDEYRILNKASKIVWLGVVLLLISGAALFAFNPEKLLASTKFLTKMTIVAAIIINGSILHFNHLAFFKKMAGKSIAKHTKKISWLIATGVISITSWASAIVLGALKSIPLSYAELMTLYLGTIGVGLLTSVIFFKQKIKKSSLKNLVFAGGALVVITILVETTLLK